MPLEAKHGHAHSHHAEPTKAVHKEGLKRDDAHHNGHAAHHGPTEAVRARVRTGLAQRLAELGSPHAEPRARTLEAMLHADELESYRFRATEAAQILRHDCRARVMLLEATSAADVTAAIRAYTADHDALVAKRREQEERQNGMVQDDPHEIVQIAGQVCPACGAGDISGWEIAHHEQMSTKAETWGRKDGENDTVYSAHCNKCGNSWTLTV